MYLFSCSRLRFSLLRLGLRKERKKQKQNTGSSVDVTINDRNVHLDVCHRNQIKKEEDGLAKAFQKEDGSIPDFREMQRKKK